MARVLGPSASERLGGAPLVAVLDPGVSARGGPSAPRRAVPAGRIRSRATCAFLRRAAARLLWPAPPPRVAEAIEGIRAGDEPASPSSGARRSPRDTARRPGGAAPRRARRTRRAPAWRCGTRALATGSSSPSGACASPRGRSSVSRETASAGPFSRPLPSRPCAPRGRCLARAGAGARSCRRARRVDHAAEGTPRRRAGPSKARAGRRENDRGEGTPRRRAGPSRARAGRRDNDASASAEVSEQLLRGLLRQDLARAVAPVRDLERGLPARREGA